MAWTHAISDVMAKLEHVATQNLIDVGSKPGKTHSLLKRVFNATRDVYPFTKVLTLVCLAPDVIKSDSNKNK